MAICPGCPRSSHYSLSNSVGGNFDNDERNIRLSNSVLSVLVKHTHVLVPRRGLYLKLAGFVQTTPDPGLQQAIYASGTALSHWHMWPLLLGLLLYSPTATNATYDPVHACLNGCLDCLGVCAAALHAALADAKGQVRFSMISRMHDLMHVIAGVVHA